MKVCLISSNQNKLNAAKNKLAESANLGADLQKKDEVFQTIKFDFRESDNIDKIQELANKINDLSGGVSVLINNVGICYGGAFEEEDLVFSLNTMVTNMLASAQLTRLLLGNFTKRIADNKKSAIINVSSHVGETPNPGTPIYSGTKAFGNLFSLSLAEEYWGKIDILAVKPSFVKSDLTELFDSRTPWYWITPEQCAQGSLKQLGKSDETYGHWKHGIYVWYKKLTPRCFIRKALLKENLDLAERGKAAGPPPLV